MMPKSQQDDLRVRRTRKLLIDALMVLTVERGFAAVTVRDLTNQAMVNRATFYHHFADKYDLVCQHVDTLLGTLQLDGKGLPTDEQRLARGELSHAGVSMLHHIATHKTFYQVMLGQEGMPGLAAYMQRYLERHIAQELTTHGYGTEQTTLPLALVVHFIANSLIGSITWWFAQEIPYPPEQIVQWHTQLVGNGIQKILSTTQ